MRGRQQSGRPSESTRPPVDPRRTRRGAHPGRVFGAALVALVTFASAAGLAQEPTPEDPIPDSRLLEEARTELVQLDLSVRGDPAAVASLTPSDIKIRIGLRRLREFTLDRVCDLPPDAPGEGERTAAAPAPALARTSYVLFFDQSHLTIAGRAAAIELARDLLPRLLEPGGRATIVSNGADVRTFAPFTADVSELSAALDAMEHDPTQVDPFAEGESARIDDVIRELNSLDPFNYASTVARRHRRAERDRAVGSLYRLRDVIGRVAALDPPKAVLYFADTMRTSAGQHYGTLLPSRELGAGADSRSDAGGALSARLAYDAVQHRAAALGVRFYAVHAGGLNTPMASTGLSQYSHATTSAILSNAQVRDYAARDTMRSFGRESGGASFLNDAGTDIIVDRIFRDLSCVFIASFAPGKYARDATYPVTVSSRKPGVEVWARGQLVIQSAAARTRARLESAFTAPGAADSMVHVASTLIPIDFVRGKYVALLQLSIPTMPFMESTWDLGATIVEARGGTLEASGRVTIPPPGAAAALEKEIRVAPGPFRVVAVAHETGSDQMASDERELDWPDPRDRTATVGPIAVVQPVDQVFVRDGTVRTRGSRAVGDDEAADPDRRAAILGLVCRDRKGARASMRVERRLVAAEASVEFEPLTLPDDGRRCVQVRDVVEAGALPSGEIQYEVRVFGDDRELAYGEHTFRTRPDPEAP